MRKINEVKSKLHTIPESPINNRDSRYPHLASGALNQSKSLSFDNNKAGSKSVRSDLSKPQIKTLVYIKVSAKDALVAS